MKALKYLLLAVVGIAALVLVALVVLVATFDPNK